MRHPVNLTMNDDLSLKKILVTANDLKGEWYPIDSGSYKNYFVKHLHTKNLVIFAYPDENGTLIPTHYILSDDTVNH
jgi:hypothetical protein